MDLLIGYLPLLAQGALVTVALALVSLALATTLGALAAAARIGAGGIVRSFVLAYTTLIRGVPDLVLILLFFYGGQRLANRLGAALGLEPISVSPFLAGVLGIGRSFGAYLAETFRGAYLTIPRGQIEAARALGLRNLPLVWTVTIPQLVRFALPGYANVWQVLVKSTAVVSVIGLQDVVGFAGDAGKTTREPFLFYTATLFVYLAITWISTRIFAWLDRRYTVVSREAEA